MKTHCFAFGRFLFQSRLVRFLRHRKTDGKSRLAIVSSMAMSSSTTATKASDWLVKEMLLALRPERPTLQPHCLVRIWASVWAPVLVTRTHSATVHTEVFNACAWMGFLAMDIHAPVSLHAESVKLWTKRLLAEFDLIFVNVSSWTRPRRDFFQSIASTTCSNVSRSSLSTANQKRNWGKYLRSFLFTLNTSFLIKFQSERRKRGKVKCQPLTSVPSWKQGREGTHKAFCPIFFVVAPKFFLLLDLGNVQRSTPVLCACAVAINLQA